MDGEMEFDGQEYGRKRGRDSGGELDTPPRGLGQPRLSLGSHNGGESKKQRSSHEGFSQVLGANLDTSAMQQQQMSKSPRGKSPHSGPALGANLNFDAAAMMGMGNPMGKGKGKGGDPMMQMMMAMMGKGASAAKGKGKGMPKGMVLGGMGGGHALGAGGAFGGGVSPTDGTPTLGVPTLTLGRNAPIATPAGQGMEPDHLGSTEENVDIRDSDCGRVIGQKGAMLNKIKTATKCQIVVKPREHRDVPRRCTISGGALNDRLKGMRMVLDLVEWANHPSTGLLVKNAGAYLTPGVFNSHPLTQEDFEMYPDHQYNFGRAPQRKLDADMQEWPSSLKPCGHNQAPRDGHWPRAEGGKDDVEPPTDAEKGSARPGGPNGTFIVHLYIKTPDVEVVQNNIYTVMKVTGAVIDVDRHVDEPLRNVRIFAPKVFCVERAKHLILKSVTYAESDGLIIKSDNANDTPASGISDGSMGFGTPHFANQFQQALGQAQAGGGAAAPSPGAAAGMNMMAMGMGIPGMPDLSAMDPQQMMQMQQNFIRQQQLQHQAAQGSDSSDDSSSDSSSDSGSDDEDLVKEKAQAEQGQTPGTTRSGNNFPAGNADIDFDDI